MTNDLLVYDIELAKSPDKVSDGWKNVYGCGIGSCVIYSFNLDKYFFFLHDSSRKNILNILSNNRVITFNGVNFDSRVLLNNDRDVFLSKSKKTTIIKKQNYFWNEYDIFVQILMRRLNISDPMLVYWKNTRSPGGLKLNDICKNTLNIEKDNSGDNAPILYQNNMYDKLLEYNFNDVQITKKLYCHILKNKNIIDGKGNIINFE